MANQMIALSGRPASIPSPASMTQRYMGMLNTMAQQRASQRQAEAFQAQQQRLEQEMAFAQQQRAEQARAAELANEAGQVAYFRELSMPVRDDATYQMWLGQVADRNPQWAAMIRQASPTYDPAYMAQLRADAEQFVNKTIATPTAELSFAPGGEAFGVTVGGTGAPTAREVTVVPREGAAAPAASAPQQQMSAPAPGASVNARATYGADTGPQDLLDQGVNPASIPMGNPLQRPINFVPGSSGQQPVAPLTMETAPQIIQNAVQNRTIDESHLQQLRQMVGPENEQALAQWMQQNGVRIQPAGQPTMRTAEYRPGQGAAPQMTQVQQTVNAPGTQFRGRDPMQSPMPGSAVVPLPRVQGEAAAQTAGSEGVRVSTQPQITRGVQRAERLERLQGDLPAARSQTQTLVDNLTDRINAIDEFLRSPNRRSIIGAIEGRIPRALQSESRADAQAMWDFITSNSVLDKLISDRQATETGASPQGLVSDRDLGVAATAANRLTQTGSEAAQDAEMKRLRDILYRTRENALRTFNDTYAEVFRERPELRVHTRPVPPIYRAQPPETQQPEPRTTSRGARVFGVRGGR